MTDDWSVWAAVDCPSGIGTMPSGEIAPVIEPMVLGELSLSITKNPEVGVENQVVARPSGQDGRKLRSDVALGAPGGGNVAVGQSIWVVLAGTAS